MATFTAPSLPVGSHTITVVYQGDGGFLPSTSAAATQQVNRAGTTSTIASTSGTTAYGQPVTFTATVSPTAPGAGTPGGTVIFFDGSARLGSAALGTDGTARFTTSSLGVTGDTPDAVYSVYGGDGSFAPSTAPAVGETVPRGGTTVTVTGTPGPPVYGQPVTITATVSAAAPAPGAPTGSVTFMDGATALATIGLDASGHATLNTSTLAAGDHPVSAVYSGDTVFAASTFAAYVQSVDRAATTVAIAVGDSPGLIGQMVTYTATVAALLTGQDKPSGSVIFLDGAAVLGSAPVDGSGAATLTIPTLAAGTHVVTAAYLGDGDFLSGVSPAATWVVEPAATATTLVASAATIVTGRPVTFTATVVATSQAGGGVPTGSVQFAVDGSPLGTPIPLLQGSASSTPVTSLGAGNHDVTAVYVNADGLFYGSTGSLAGGESVSKPARPTSTPFVVGSDGQLYDRALDAAGNPTGVYHLTAVGQTKDLAASGLGGGQGFEAFVVGGDNKVYAETFSAAGIILRSYFATAYGSTTSVSSGTDASGNPLLFAIGTDNQLYEQKYNSAGTAISPAFTKAAFGDFKMTVLTHDQTGNPLLYAVGQDNQVYGLKMDAAGTPKGGLFKVDYGQVNQLAVGRDAASNPEVFVVGSDGGVYTHKLDSTGSTIGPYVGIGGPMRSISVTNDAGNNPEVFGIGGDGQVYGHKFDAAGNPTGSFFKVGAAGVPGGPRAIYAGVGPNDSPELFAVASADGQVYAAPFNAFGDPTGPFVLTTPGQVKKLVIV